MQSFVKILFLVLLHSVLYSHTLVLDMMDNNDDTMTIRGMFNTGESASGALIKIESLDSQEILFQQRLSDDSELVIPIPKVPYNVILDGGPGHTTKKIGIPPQDGFQKEVKEEKTQVKKEERQSKTSMGVSSSNAVNISILIAFLLLLSTTIVSIKNTNKLMAELKK
ncbi:MAG: hypothetical protein M0P43_05495 [Arcobacteraceae bacterium]|nr:hypothetical protein [Arcobacteraceae bacterium]